MNVQELLDRHLAGDELMDPELDDLIWWLQDEIARAITLGDENLAEYYESVLKGIEGDI